MGTVRVEDTPGVGYRQQRRFCLPGLNHGLGGWQAGEIDLDTRLPLDLLRKFCYILVAMRLSCVFRTSAVERISD
jgi:hypothetical protein